MCVCAYVVCECGCMGVQKSGCTKERETADLADAVLGHKEVVPTVGRLDVCRVNQREGTDSWKH